MGTGRVDICKWFENTMKHRIPTYTKTKELEKFLEKYTLSKTEMRKIRMNKCSFKSWTKKTQKTLEVDFTKPWSR